MSRVQPPVVTPRVRGGRGLDAVVVGAGVVGSATALGLARAGFRIALVETRLPRPWHADEDRDLRVFAIAPASSRMLQGLGVWDAIRHARTQPYREMRVWDAGGEGELHFRASDIGADALGHIIEQGAIQHALWQALQRESHVESHCPATVVALTQGDDGIALDLDDGSRLNARLVIAADGADSPLRSLAGLEVQGHAYGQRAVVAYVQTEHPHADTAWQRFLPTGPLALLPCAEGLGSIVWTLPESEAERLLTCDDEQFNDELTRAFDARLGAMTLASARAAFPLRLQLAQRYVAGRVVLIGDAAHVVHPLAGQGVNLGLQDAVELIRVLTCARDAGRDIASSANLRRYERVRRSENALAARAFDGLNRFFSNEAFLPILLRGPALGLVNRLTPLKRLFARHAAGLVR